MDKKLRVVGSEETYFGDVLSAIGAEKKLNQYQIAVQTGYSQPAISRIERGSRPLTPNLANRLAIVLGGNSEDWLKVHDETRGGSLSPVVFYRNMILGTDRQDDLPGTRIRRMRGEDILNFFGENLEGIMEFRGVTEDCEIADFDPLRVQKSTYEIRIGGVQDPDDQETPFEQVIDTLIIPAGETRLICVREHITLPSWLEAEIHPASNIGRKGLIVSSGPIIDPGWSGFVQVSVFNPTKSDKEITTEEPFLTLRFWMQDGH